MTGLELTAAEMLLAGGTTLAAADVAKGHGPSPVDQAAARKAARGRIKPIPDPEAGKAAKRKAAGRKRMQRGGRASTILSASEDKLGG